MNNLQNCVDHNVLNPSFYYFTVCFFEKPYQFYTYKSLMPYALFSLVEVSFGVKKRQALIWEQLAKEPEATFKIKEIDCQIADPLLTNHSKQLMEFCIRYYQSPLQEVLAATVPSVVRKKAHQPPILTQTQTGAQLSPLTLDQQKFIENFSKHNGFAIHLLQGVTGSGKTRCYLELIAKTIAAGRNVLMMVPEINLTPQLITQLNNLSGVSLITYHSQLTPKKRADAFYTALNGKEGLVFVTTRSGVFLPYQNLGLIVIDEEHDPSYKQQEGNFRYHARDCAIKLAQLHNCPCLLGTATPSLRSSLGVKEERFYHSELTQRATGQPLPQIIPIPGPKSTWREPLSFNVLKKVRDYLSAGHQVLFYLNRRGYVPRLFCSECRSSLLCTSCLTPYVYHLDKNLLSCHHCQKNELPPKVCSSCEQELIPLGFGTERLAEFLTFTFPDIPVFVIDTDHLTTHKQVVAQFEEIKKTNQALIIGTQMIGKGHDWPKVQLVVLLIAAHELDESLDEHVASQFVQAAGRCGRHAPGEVLLVVSHDQILSSKVLSLMDHNYLNYVNELLETKKKNNLPPFTHQAKLLFQATDQKMLLSRLRQLVQPYSMLEIQGPFFDYPMKRGTKWRIYIMVQVKSRTLREQHLKNLLSLCHKDAFLKKTFMGVDIDPLD